MLVLNKGIEQNRKFGENIKKKQSEMIPFQLKLPMMSYGLQLDLKKKKEEEKVAKCPLIRDT